MRFLKGIYFLNLGFGNKYGNEEKILQRLLMIDVILLGGSFFYVIYDLINDLIINGHYAVSDIPIILLFITSVISLFLYKRKYFFAVKLLTAFTPQLYIFGCAYFGIQRGEHFFWLPLVLMGFAVFPILIFDQKREKKWLFTAMVFNLLYLVFYDSFLLPGADAHFIEVYRMAGGGMVFYKSVQIVLYVFLMFLLYYVIRVNNHHQILCERINKSLSRERDRLDILNAEILAQRNAINKAASILVTDEKGNIQSANRNFCEITGYKLKELIGKNPRIFNSGYHDNNFFRDMWNTINDGQIWSGEIRNKRKDGSVYWLDTTIAPLYDRERKLTGFLAIRFDCTKRKLFEEDLVKLNKEKEYIMYAIAHDLKNPLRNLLTILRLDKSNALNEKQRDESFDMIENDCRYSLKLINQLLEIGKLESMNNGLHKEPVNLRELLKKNLDQFEETIKEKKLKVELKHTGLNHKIFLDPDKFKNVMVNLIYNAIKFTPEGGKITIETVMNEKHTEIRIIDTGIGIPEKLMPHIFEKFSKASRPGTNGEKSSGLGLCIVKKIIELHGGEIKVSSKENEGTKVEVIIS